jgi:hypothetical protein
MPPVIAEFSTSRLRLQNESPFRDCSENAIVSVARVFHFELFQKNAADCKNVWKEAVRNFAGNNKRPLWRNTSSCSPKVNDGCPTPGTSLREESPILNLCSQVLI